MGTINGDMGGTIGTSTSSGGGITINTTVITGGTNKRVLFDDNGVVGEDAGFTYDKATDIAVLGGLDTPLLSPTGNTIDQRNGSNIQTARWFNYYTDATHYSGFQLTSTGNGASTSPTWVFGNIRGADGGFGANLVLYGETNLIHRSNGLIAFQNNSTTTLWYIDTSSGHILANADNTYDIGASGATRPRNIFAGGYLSAGRNVVAKATDYPVVAADLNNFFTNTGAGAGVTFTLPTPIVGMTYEFYRDANQTVTIDVGGAVVIRVGASASTAGGNVTLDAVGSRIRLVAISTTLWVGDLTGAATFN